MSSGQHSPRTGASRQSVARSTSILPLSLLGRRLQNFSRRDVSADLRSLVSKRRAFSHDTPTWASRGDLGHIAVLEEGWAYKFTIMPKGQRHIAELYGPGSIVNWSRLSSFIEQDDVLFKAHSRVSYLDRHALTDLLRANTALETAVKRHELARAMRASQRTRALISLPATERLLFLFLDLVNEYHAVGHTHEWLRLPFVQSEIADFVGMTPVHISRTLKSLVEGGIVQRSASRFRFTDIGKTEGSLDYRRYFDAPVPR